jgi:hypothetical protein
MAVSELPAQRQVGQRIERVVEIEQQLAPLHAIDVVGRPHLRPGTDSFSADAPRRAR